MNTTFKIVPTNIDVPNNILVEISTSNVGVICYTTFPFVINGFYYFNLTEKDKAGAFLTELNEHLNFLKEQVNVFYNYADSTLVPSTFFKKDELNNIAALMYGNKLNAINVNETITELSIENIYSVPQNIKNEIESLFPAAKSYHSLSKLIQHTNGTKLYATIYHNEIRVILFKENNFTLASYFDYTTPEDVCYHLLNVCQQNEVSVTEVELVLNGMIETTSNLYKEMYKFFLNIAVDALPEKVLLAENFDGLSEHYFSPLVKLAKCVS